MAVTPSSQRQGIGSMMMQQICNEADHRRQCSYVLALPQGVRLYEKFGFKNLGHVETPYGLISSMFRSALGSGRDSESF